MGEPSAYCSGVAFTEGMMKLGSADPDVERADFVGRGVFLEEPNCECLAVARFGVLVGVSCREVEWPLLERSGVALSSCSCTISLSESSKSRSLFGSLEDVIRLPSEVY
jgi:hypothetical protein